jgi:dephospho-CoA kinase
MAERLRIGLTGGVASGKTTVARRFSELEVPVIDADQSSRSVVAPGQPGLGQVVAAFGAALLTADGELDRRALRSLVFADPLKRQELESILHPLIRADMERRAKDAVGAYLVLAIPLLVEGGGRNRVDRILVVDAPEAIQLERLVARDSVGIDEARAILAAQANRTDRLQAADDVLVNTGTVPELRLKVDRLHRRYLRLAGAMRP